MWVILKIGGVQYIPKTRNSVITYYATDKLGSYTIDDGYGYQETFYELDESKFDCNILSHTFENGVGTIVFDGTLTEIRGWAFNSEKLNDIEIPSSVSSVVGEAFGYKCYNLPVIDGLRYGGDILIECVEEKEQHVIKQGTRFIQNGVFRFKTSIKHVTIPNSVISIGSYAFDGCTELSEIVCYPSIAPTLGEYHVFDGILTSGTLKHPAGSDYSSWTGYWEEYQYDDGYGNYGYGSQWVSILPESWTFEEI